ncbi:PREDICTED: putative gustatory receptor 28b [Nicrophorus vespilloides]|uniref:Gustatory receptor n=1 Tax=Nicrophorus vespilloides TaxID=110193 RepID=A0ABM1MUC9_NICVS|nr:PREDICTED: putative gustatory receptor 28b [Nicrophorus vespilloides]
MDIYDTLIPVYVLSKILGLAPFKLSLKGNRGFVSDVGPIIITRILVLLSVMIFVAWELENLDFPDNIAGIAMRVELYLGTVMTGIVLILAVVNRRGIIGSVNNLMEVDRLLKAADIAVSYKNAKTFCAAQIIFITCVFSSKIIIQPFSSKTSLLYIYSVFNIVDYINTIMLFQYVDLFLLIRQRYIWLNRSVRNLGMEMKIHFLKSQCLPLDSLIVQYGIIHNALYQIGNKINRSYGVQLLVTIIVRFIMVTTQLIYAYKIIQDPEQGDPISYTLLFMYLMLHTTKLFMVASISTNTSTKGQETGLYLHNLWESYGRNREEIMFFSLQVLHQKANYSACGFFNLDYQLISSIVGAITTHLIIIIQFDHNTVRVTQNGTLF